MNQSKIVIGLVCFLLTGIALAENISDLPIYKKNNSETPDWLIDSSSYQSGLYRNASNSELVLANGLIQRVFRIAPNAATVALDDLKNGKSWLRGVRPEALVKINGTEFSVGGLQGQKNQAFLLPEDLDVLTSDKDAFQYTGFSLSKNKERFSWKKTRHYDKSLAWPVPGTQLTLHFAFPQDIDTAKLVNAKLEESSAVRDTLISDDFAELTNDWKKVYSKAHPRSSFENEGRNGEIYTPAGSAVFVERELLAGTELVQCEVNAGTDRSGSWGPGMTLVYPNKTVKFFINTEKNRLAVFDGQKEKLLKRVPKAKTQEIRIRLDNSQLIFESRQEGAKKWQRQYRLSAPEGMAKIVRLGKTSATGNADDAPKLGGLSFSHIYRFRAFSKVKESEIVRLKQNIESLKKVTVDVHHVLYDGMPVMSKWIVINNNSSEKIHLDTYTNEKLAIVENESHPEGHTNYDKVGADYSGQFRVPDIQVLSDFMHGSFTPARSNVTTNWMKDPQYKTQVHFRRQNPCLLECRMPIGPDTDIAAGGKDVSFRNFMIIHDSQDRERQSLTLRAAYRKLAPWASENPIMMHVRSAKPERVKEAIDQCAEVGFEVVILTFGSGFNIENDSPEYIAKYKEVADYAHSKGIQIGCYSLLSSRRVGAKHDCINVHTGKPGGHGRFGGNSPCLGSEWGQNYFRKLYNFYEKSGFDLFEHDGSYGGHHCASTTHPGHDGYLDSHWKQYNVIADFYKWSRGKGIYLNIPDSYYLVGANKCGMGYREKNWALPREQQILHARQNIFDGTWTKTASMGWMFVPLTSYKGGGKEAVIEPLNDHLDTYENHMATNFGMGVQPMFRGPRLYDTERTKEAVKRWVSWYKEYRGILESDVIHLRRPDGRDIDYMLHVNPKLKRKGMLSVYNPLNKAVTKTIKVPLYYTGLSDETSITDKHGKVEKVKLKRDYSIRLEVTVPANGMSYYIFE